MMEYVEITLFNKHKIVAERKNYFVFANYSTFDLCL
jgi:hypothetical protein